MSVFCIGGSGGSGTRLVTSLLHEHNVPIGHALNGALDNLFFTLIFRRPSWFSTFPASSVILEAIDIYTRNMHCCTGEFDSPSDQTYINALIAKGDTTIFSSSEWHAHVQTHFKRNKETNSSPNLWGWKEPNTHVFLPHLNIYNDKIKYIHVIRDGIYMMNSKNQNQLKMWANKFNVVRSNQSANQIDALNFWITSNYETILYGQDTLKKRFYLLDYDQFCKQPEKESLNLLSFLELPYRIEIVQKIVQLVRHKEIDHENRDFILERLPTDVVTQYHELLHLAKKTL